MSFLQNLWRDLVDKRLWPVAVALVLAAVAVPVLMGGGSSTVTPAPAAPAPTGAAVPGTAQVTVAVDAGTKERSRAGSARDPFKPLIFAKVAKATGGPTTGATASAEIGSSSAAGSTRSSGGSGALSAPPSLGTGSGNGTGSTPPKSSPVSPSTPSTPSVSPTTPGVTHTQTTRRFYTYALTLQLKRSGQISWRHNLQAVSYVPSPSAPLLAFLGVRSDGKTATFLVGDRVQVTGKAASCRPSPENCRFLELKQGDTVLFAKVPANGAAAKHYRLSLTRVAFVPVSKATRAAAARRTRAAGSAAAPALAPAQQVTRSVRTAG